MAHKMAATPKSRSGKTLAEAVETNSRLEMCWKADIKWNLYPQSISEVGAKLHRLVQLFHMINMHAHAHCQGCNQVGKALCMPPTAVLCGLLVVTAFCLSHASVSVPGTEWTEPILLWISIGMPTGSGKSPLYKFLLGLLRKARVKICLNEDDPSWLLEEATFEKMGAMMAENHSKLLGLYDKLSSFLTQINLYKSRGLSDSYDLALFLQLYNGHPWSRKTGK